MGRGEKNKHQLELKGEDYEESKQILSENVKTNFKRNFKSSGCGAGRGNFFVDYDGKIYGCATLREFGCKLGEINNIKEVINYEENASYKEMTKLIVICISTNNLEMGQEYEKLINKLSIQGKILFASWTNNGRDTLSYPAILKNVISVGRKKMDSKFIECDWKNNIQCLINIDISYIWIPEKGFRSFGGNSQATADLVAMVCKRIGYVRDIKEMRKRIDELDYNYYRIYRDYECETDQRLLSIIEKYSKTFTAESAMWEIFPTIEELSDFLEEICTIFEINKYTVIFKRSMFVSIKKFSNTINIIKNGEKKYEN